MRGIGIVMIVAGIWVTLALLIITSFIYGGVLSGAFAAVMSFMVVGLMMMIADDA